MQNDAILAVLNPVSAHASKYTSTSQASD